jgi:hypothetical protein
VSDQGTCDATLATICVVQIGHHKIIPNWSGWIGKPIISVHWNRPSFQRCCRGTEVLVATWITPLMSQPPGDTCLCQTWELCLCRIVLHDLFGYCNNVDLQPTVGMPMIQLTSFQGMTENFGTSPGEVWWRRHSNWHSAETIAAAGKSWIWWHWSILHVFAQRSFYSSWDLVDIEGSWLIIILQCKPRIWNLLFRTCCTSI